MRFLRLAFFLLMCGCAATTGAGGLSSSTPPPSGTILPAGTASASPAATVSPIPYGSVTPSPTPTYTGSRTLVESDSGATIKLTVGEIVKISLPAEYDPPQARSDVMIEIGASGGYPTGNPLEATFRANKVGSTDITTETDYACLHSHPACGIAQRLWIVHVVVS